MKRNPMLIVGLLVFLHAAASSGENRFRVGFQAGPFISADWQVQGQSVTDHGEFFSSLEFSGFGNGVDLMLSLQYDFSSWGVRTESGVQLFETRKLVYGSLGLRRKYENRMLIVPVVFSLIRNVELNAPRLSHFFGVGGGIYLIDMETKYRYLRVPYNRMWLKESSVLPGFHFLAGFDYRLFKKLFAGFEYRYNFAVGDFHLDNVDNDQRTNIYDLNIGGTSLRLGFGYRF
jgi:hypothetical protein